MEIFRSRSIGGTEYGNAFIIDRPFFDMVGFSSLYGLCVTELFQ